MMYWNKLSKTLYPTIKKEMRKIVNAVLGLSIVPLLSFCQNKPIEGKTINPKFEKNLTLAEILMKPTIIYTKAFLAANKNHKVKSISHITGGGLIDNPPRAFNKNLTLKFDMKNFKLPPIFKWLKDKSNISLFELTKTFNCGIGFLIFADKNDAQEIIKDINKIGYNAFLIGSMIKNNSEKNVVFDGWNF